MGELALDMRPAWRVAVVGVALVGLLGACIDETGQPVQTASLQQDNTLTPAERQLRAKTEEKRKAEGAVAGAAGGALLGALTGYFIGGWSGAAIGAATGIAAGAA